MKKILLNRYFLIFVIFVIGAVFYATDSSSEKRKRHDTRTLTPVIKGELIQRSTIAGTVIPLRRTIITAPYQGYVRKVYVKIGQMVKSGDPIASVSQTLATEDTVFPLRSPFSGKVVQVNKAEGEYVKASDATDFIARIDDLSKMFVESNIPELDRVKMKIGLEAVVKASAILDRTYKAVVQELTFAAREQDRYGRSTGVEFPMRLEILDFDSQIQPGMSVIVDITTLKKENTLLLPQEFIAKEKETFYVTLVNGIRRNVILGAQNEESSEILSGVLEGDQVRKVDFAEINQK